MNQKNTKREELFDRGMAQNLIREAFEARKTAYAPYSGFYVGAALLTQVGGVYHGCNIENAAYGDSCCAERTAFFKAVSEGHRSFWGIAIVGGKKLERCSYSEKKPEGEPLQETVDTYAFPCGSCRQVMSEFCNPEFVVIVAKSIEDYQIYQLKELIPFSFDRELLS